MWRERIDNDSYPAYVKSSFVLYFAKGDKIDSPRMKNLVLDDRLHI